MAYNNNIPQSTDLLSQSQADILANFQAIQTLIGVNHVNFNAADQGKHNFCQFPVQVAAPATSGTEVALYSEIGVSTGVPELTFRRDTNGTIIEFTAGINGSPGYTRLPSGLLVKWGNAGSLTGNTLITMPLVNVTPIPSFTTAVFYVGYTLQTGSGANAFPYWNVGTTTLLDLGIFVANISTGAAATATVTWYAIGL